MSRQQIRQLAAMATEDEIEAASSFYVAAHEFACGVARLAYGGTSEAETAQAAALIAALSPRSDWAGNQLDAVAIASGSDHAGGGFQALGRDLERAERIADGEPWVQVLSGPKVSAFARNIMQPGLDAGLPIDRHLGRAALGWRMTDEDLTRSLARSGAYEAVEQTYTELALAEGLRPIEYVNRIWYVVRRLRKSQGQTCFDWTPMDWRPMDLQETACLNP